MFEMLSRMGLRSSPGVAAGNGSKGGGDTTLMPALAAGLGDVAETENGSSFNVCKRARRSELCVRLLTYLCNFDNGTLLPLICSGLPSIGFSLTVWSKASISRPLAYLLKFHALNFVLRLRFISVNVQYRCLGQICILVHAVRCPKIAAGQHDLSHFLELQLSVKVQILDRLSMRVPFLQTRPFLDH